ncbi:uncharacterized protein LOC134250867 [Saccostrea cucullata]|uniref:uncharacterized protein LOC134250867 n=1 Tax=Saccostrea cuccullata TaxID=36930 RepID=UPI002ED5B268
MGNKMMLATVLSWGLISVGFTYIVSDWKQPVCPFVKCQNDGVLDRTTCRCNCPPRYFGYFCEKVKLRTKWPDGTYALPASMFGCPETEDRDWTLSYINLTLPDSAQRQYWNTKDPDLLNGIIEPNILGPYYYRAIQMNFCVKNLAYFDDENNDTTKEWPKGEYCIYNLNECPQGFSNGSLTISGYQFTHQDIGGVIPGETGSNMSLMLKFCCREDGDYRTSIKLPSEFPFVLFQSMSADGCQEVTSMITQRDYFYMTNEHDDWQFEGTLPMFNRTAINGSIGVAYCYYEPYDHRECYYDTDHGNSYNGRKSVSASGKACLIWTDSDFDFFHNDKRTYHEFDENYCRAYEYFTYKSRKPLCLVEFPNVKEECNVPICAEEMGLQEFGKFKPFRSVPNAGDNYPDYPVDGFIGTLNSFVSSRPMMKPWYQIDLQEYVEVHAIIIYRYATYFPNNMRYVGTYISKNQWDFMNYGAVRCDDVRLPGYSRVFRYQCRRPVVGQYVTIRNFDFTHPDINPGNYFKMEINEITILGKSTTCGRALGMASGNIYDYQLESSSDDTEGVEVMPLSFRGRLYHPDPGWCASKKDEQPWFMIDLIISTVIQGVIIQGWISGIYTRYIQSFQVSYGVTRNTMTRYRASPGTVKTFVTDTTIEVSTPQTFLFHTDILARYIKIHPIVKDSQQACFKTEVIGCQKQLQRDIKCKRDTIDFGYEELKRFSYWLEKEDNSPFDAKNISSIKGCRQFCLRNNCTALSFQKYTSSQRCSLSFGDRYHPTRTVAWVQTGSSQHYASHRLCFKNAHPILPCIFPINLQQRKEAVIRSPGFPFSYGQGLNCTWNIFVGDSDFVTLEIVYLHLAKPTTKIALKELGIFDINPGKCKESLLITEQSNTIEISTDTERDYRDTTVISSGKILSVRLKSCFQMSAEKREKNFEIKVTKSGKPGCGMTDEGCTVTCTLQSAYIATKRYPAPYKAEETCTWRIEGTFGQYVDLKILHLDVINGDATCSNSYIAVYDIDLSESEKLLGRFCKENRPYRNITSRWHRMRIEFHSGNGEKQGQGFLGLYTFVNFTQRYLDMENGECSGNWYYNNGSCYRIFTDNEGITWQKAEQKCIQQNGSLVSINSKQELSFIHFLLTNAMNITRDWEIYIGLRKIYSEENDELNYMWTDENPLTFTAWFRGDNIKDGQPNGVHNELCTSIRFSSIHSIHDWHDTACAYNKIKSYLCEIEIVKQNETILRENWWGIGSLESQSSARLDNILLKCENTELINRLFVCDGMEDCFDGSDESNCSTTCTETQFQCSSGDCVSVSLYCDFVSHCPDNSDETNCIRRPCTDKEWECYSGQCIPAVNRCDMKVDCVDGSDEDYCVNCNNGFECYDQTCLHLSKVCDGFIDCSGFFAEDESQNCENNVRRSCKDWWRLGKRENGEYLVNMGLIGIGPSKVECQFVKANDHVSVRTVIHHSEEETLYTRLTEVDITLKYKANQAQIAKLKEMNNCSQKVRVRCHYIYVNIDVMLEGQNGQRLHTRSGDQQNNCSCPFVSKCEKGKSKCNCNSTLGEWYGAEATEVREDAGIITNHSFLPIKRVFIHCPGENKFIKLNIGPLECSEETDNVNIDFLCRTGKIVPISRRCILDYDVYGDIIGCRDLSHLDECESIACPSGYMKCPGSFCIPPRLICDGEKHCKNGVDEMNCESCPGLYRCKDSTVCLNPNKLCDNITHCPLGDDELLCFITCPDKCQCDGLSSICRDIQNKSIIKLPSQLRYLDLSENNFSNGLPSLKHLKDLIRLFMADCGLTSIESFTFINQRNLLKLDLRNNKITQLHSNAFTGLVSLKDLQMEGNELLTEIADQAFLGLQSLPEMTLTNSRLWNIQRNTLVGLQNVRQLNLSANRIRFISDFAFQNLSNVIVLDMQRNEVKQFSSQIFNGLLKLQKLYTDSYAFCCLKPTSVKECLPTADEFSSCDDLMRNDILSTFMWITGFCSLFGNLGVFIFKVRFDSHTLKKSHGIFITNLSVSDFLMGIYLIIIASADQYYRGKYIWNDVRWRESTACQIAGMLATISSEMSVFLLCLITIDRLIAVKFPFGQLRFSRTRALYCIGILWSATVLLSAIPLIPGRYFKQKFYSRSVVCLALPLTRDRPAGWEYSTAIFIILNFILFLIIALGQCLIYREISNTSSKVNSTRRTHEMVIARGLFLIVLSDCLCWCPIGIMGLLALNGHVISGEVYTWVAVFILPINSALNPFLYSFSSIRSRVELAVLSQKRTVSGTHSATETYTELCENDLFIIGKNAPLFVTLSEYMRNHTLTLPEIKLVVLRLSEAMKFLHDRDLVHGCLDTSLVSLDVEDGEIKDLSIKIEPHETAMDENIRNDMKQLGEITLRMLKNHQSDTTHS